MDPQVALNPESIRLADYAYFAGGIVVIVLGGFGAALLALGILQLKRLKPFKDKYPYEQFKSFEEFANQQPADPSAGPVSLTNPQERIQHNEEIAKETPVLTWDNAPDAIESLTKDDVKSIKENTTTKEPLLQDADSENVSEKQEEVSVN